MGPEGIVSCGSHGRAHVVCVGDAVINDRADSCAIQERPLVSAAQQNTPGARDGPLGRWGSLAAVAQRIAVLPFCRREMGGTDGAGHIGVSAVDADSGQKQTLRHGGAGAVQPKKGNAHIPYGEAGADALVQKISGEQSLKVTVVQFCLFQGNFQGGFLHGAFGFLPGFLTERGVGIDVIEIGGQKPF